MVPCKACGFVPVGPERAVAWLFSREHLSEAELEHAAARVRQGDRPEPSRALQDQARAAMGATRLPLSDAGQRPLTPRTLVALSAANLLLTPLAGIAVWVGLRDGRPRAARQALLVTLPVLSVLAVAWVLVGLFRPWT